MLRPRLISIDPSDIKSDLESDVFAQLLHDGWRIQGDLIVFDHPTRGQQAAVWVIPPEGPRDVTWAEVVWWVVPAVGLAVLAGSVFGAAIAVSVFASL